MKERLINIIVFNLKHSHSDRNHGEWCMLKHIIQLLPEETLNKFVESYFRGNYPDSFDNFYKCEEFNEDFINFHKSLRQTDVFDNGHLDMIWWNLISISNVTYKAFRNLFDKEF